VSSSWQQTKRVYVWNVYMYGMYLVCQFKLFAAGLEALLSDEVSDEEKDVEVTAGLGLDLIDTSLRPITFFVGQTGLMSALWNAPAELTPALQVLISHLFVTMHARGVACLWGQPRPHPKGTGPAPPNFLGSPSSTIFLGHKHQFLHVL